MYEFYCRECGHEWDAVYMFTGFCPMCDSTNITDGSDGAEEDE